MNYSITINQKSQCDLGLENDLDLIDHTIFDHCVKFSLSKKITSMQEDGKIYYWFSYKNILQENPALRNMIKSKDGIYRRMKKMCDLGIFDLYPGSKNLSQSFYAFGDLASRLSGLVPDGGGYGSESDAYGSESGGGPSDTEPMNHYTNSIDHSTKPFTASEKKSDATKASSKEKEFKQQDLFEEDWLSVSEKKEKKQTKKEKNGGLHQRFVDLYFEWFPKYNAASKPKFGGPEQKNIKLLREYLVSVSSDEEEAYNTFMMVCQKWKKLPEWIKENFDINFIYKHINRILTTTKPSPNDVPDSYEEFAAYRDQKLSDEERFFFGEDHS